VKEKLTLLKKAANNGENLVPYVIECVKEYATIGEICDALKEEFGEYKEPVIF